MSTRHMDGIYDILNFMTGDELFTHQLPRAMKQCAPELLQQHPQLSAVVCDWSPQNDETAIRNWLQQQTDKFGESLDVSPLRQYEHRDPVDELCEMAGKEKVIVVDATERQ